jgi:hypothetical protein
MTAVPTAVPFANGVHDLLLILMVTGATVAGAFVTGSIVPEAAAPVAQAAVVVAGSETPKSTFSRPGASLCRCPGPERLVTAESPGSDSPHNPPPARGTRAEAGSFAAWQRAESDPRRILARLAALSRNAPPKHATDPGSGFDAPEVR